MRRPVGVKGILVSFCWTRFFLPPSSHCRHASIRTLEERSFRSVHVGRSRFSRCCYLISDLTFTQEWNVGQAINAVTGTRLWLLSFPLPGMVLLLGGYSRYPSVAVVQWFVHFSADPQVMQQHRQLSRGGNDGTLLAVSSTTFGQLQSPAYCTSRVRKYGSPSFEAAPESTGFHA